MNRIVIFIKRKQLIVPLMHLGFVIILFTQYLTGQNVDNKDEWKVLDQDFNKLFIKEYQKLLDPLTPEEEIPLPEDVLIVSIDKPFKGPESIAIESEDPDSDTALTIIFNNDVIKQMDSLLIQKLRKRQYEWDEIDWKVTPKYGRNIYRFVDYKEIRDHYWWTRRIIEFSPIFYDNAVKYRPLIADSPIGFMFKGGFEEIGNVSELSNNYRFILSTEATQLMFFLPITMPSWSIGEAHPADKTTGVGIKFDFGRVGGMLSRHSINNLKMDDSFNSNHSITLNWTGAIYWSHAFRVSPQIPGPISKDIEEPPPIIPTGVQRVKVGVNFSNYSYGRYDSTKVYRYLDKTDLSSSFSVFFRIEYLSKKVVSIDEVTDYSKWSSVIMMNLGERFIISGQLMYSYNPSFSIGGFFVAAAPLTFLKGQENEYTWSPGFLIGPNLSLKW